MILVLPEYEEINIMHSRNNCSHAKFEGILNFLASSIFGNLSLHFIVWAQSICTNISPTPAPYASYAADVKFHATGNI